MFWRYVAALDDYIIETGHTPSNGVIQAILFAPLLDRMLLESNRSDLDVRIDDLMTPPCASLGVARRDRELARQIFMAHRRMIQPGGRRGRKTSLVQRQYFHDALLFLGLLGRGPRSRRQRARALAACSPLPAGRRPSDDDDGDDRAAARARAASAPSTRAQGQSQRKPSGSTKPGRPPQASAGEN